MEMRVFFFLYEDDDDDNEEEGGIKTKTMKKTSVGKKFIWQLHGNCRFLKYHCTVKKKII